MFRRHRYANYGYGSYSRKSNSLIVIIYILFGLYVINMALNFIKIPEQISLVFDKWILIVGGILLIFSGLKSLTRRYY